MEKLETQQNHTFFQFDVLRAFAILGVFFVHAQYAFFGNFNLDFGQYFVHLPAAPDRHKLTAFLPTAFGGRGLTLFFIISGFLIHYITLKKGAHKFDVGMFFNKRFWRIYPPYFLALILFTFSKTDLTSIFKNPADFISHLFLVHNYNDKYLMSINPVFWSLAIEIQFYLAYPLFLFLRNKLGMDRLMILLIILSILINVFNWYSGMELISGLNGFFTGILTVTLGMMSMWYIWGFGAYLADKFYSSIRTFVWISWPLLAFFLILCYGISFMIISKYVSPFVEAFLITVVVEKYIHFREAPSSGEKILIPMGLCSFSFYLIHMPVLPYLYTKIDLFHLAATSAMLSWMVNSMVIFFILFLFSYGAYIFIESPSIRMGNLILSKIRGKRTES